MGNAGICIGVILQTCENALSMGINILKRIRLRCVRAAVGIPRSFTVGQIKMETNAGGEFARSVGKNLRPRKRGFPRSSD